MFIVYLPSLNPVQGINFEVNIHVLVNVYVQPGAMPFSYAEARFHRLPMLKSPRLQNAYVSSSLNFVQQREVNETTIKYSSIQCSALNTTRYHAFRSNYKTLQCISIQFECVSHNYPL